MSYHVPVLLKESIEGLYLQQGGVYADLTFGGGGHTKEILKNLEGGRVFGFDQDQDAVANANDIQDDRFTLIEGNFRFMKRYLKFQGVEKIDGLLADLGISSHQIDSPDRGFSTRFDGKLDMRMDRSAKRTAREVVSEYSEEDLHRIFGMYGEVRNARTLAAAIVKSRVNKQINTIADFKDIVLPLAPRKAENKYLAQVFQGLRIEVNDELKSLEEMLLQTSEVIRKGGRLVIISYHSLEDRIVKNFINKGKFFGELEKDIYGNYETPFHAINKKPIEASDEEVKINNRARSAKLRIAERN